MFMYQKFTIPSKYVFFKQPGDVGDTFSFSSDMEKIGVEWDVSIQNGTYVDVISDPMEITKQPYGTFSVVKIKADVATDYHTIIKEFWVPSCCVVKVEDD